VQTNLARIDALIDRCTALQAETRPIIKPLLQAQREAEEANTYMTTAMTTWLFRV